MNRLLVATTFSLLLAGQAAGQLITAHRGASHDAPENTLAAFQLAWEQAADAIEGDFRLSSDGRIVCVHDADTKRVAGVNHVVADTPLEQLRELDAGRWKDARFEGEKLPTFAEVLAAVPPGKRFFIELKTGPAIVPVLVEELAAWRGDPALLTIIAFDADTVANRPGADAAEKNALTNATLLYNPQNGKAMNTAQDTILVDKFP